MNFRPICFMVVLIGFVTTNRGKSIIFDDFYPHERDALIELRDRVISTHIDLHSEWTGPPCYRNTSNWVGITCLNSHVVHIVLEEVDLIGSLPPTSFQNITFLSILSFQKNTLYGRLPSLAGLMHLQFVLLSQNSFSGSIPGEFVTMPILTRLELEENFLTGNIPPFNQSSLTIFNVSYNSLQGLIPETPTLQRFSESSYEHNLELCGKPLDKPCSTVSPVPSRAPPSPQNPPKQPKSKPLKLWGIILIAVAAALAPLIIVIVCLCYYKKMQEDEKKDDNIGSIELSEKRTQSSGSTGDPERKVELEFFDRERPSFDLDDLLRASAEMMGKGKMGSTYKATIESGLVVAVKRVKNMNGLNKKDFLQQMQLLGRMKHENLVEIISFYYSKEEKLVIYEYVPHGSLFELLHENRGEGRVPLNWRRRLSIVKDIAKGLAYLHESLPSHKVPHANLKSSNVLIDQFHHAKLTDFGFLPLLFSPKAFREKLCIGRSPEFSEGKKLTHKADVYCFGVILLEVITGRIPWTRDGDLSDWVRSVVDNDWSTDIIDLEIVGLKEAHDEMLKLTDIALECTCTAPEQRPKISQVLARIENIEQPQEQADR